MTIRFGTDGVRGTANSELTPALVLDLARAASITLDIDEVVVGRDTRRSGPMLEAALSAGFAAEGVAVRSLGVAPTPAVAWAAARRAAAGAVISASHNPFADNGIKLFAPGGRKLTDEQEARLEECLADLAAPHRTGAEVGTLGTADDLDGYVEAVVATAGVDLAGMSIVLDVANGAAVHTAPAVFRRLGAEVHVINDQPDGVNINDSCGATHPGPLADAVRRHGADLGLAFDGDADRCVAVDAAGAVLDGDQLIAALAIDLNRRGLLVDRTVVVTVMTNLGFRRAMAAAGIAVTETAVGDRYVLDAMEAGGHVLGGEQSGHVILRHLAATGDGTLTGVQFAAAMVRAGTSAAGLGAIMQRTPQHLVNVRLERRDPRILERLDPMVDAARARLASAGRVLVRASGTEPLVRVMVEADDDDTARREADALAQAAAGIARDLDTVA